MLYLVGAVLSTFRKLFPKGKHRNQAIFLAAVATIVPLSQLFVIRIFTQMILDGTNQELASTIINFTLFFGLFVISHLATYFQKTYRVKVFNEALDSRGGPKNRMTESWDWALTFETNNLLHTFSQATVLSIFFITVNWQAGLVNVLIVLATFMFVKVTFKKQIQLQDGFALAQKNKQAVANVTKVAARIKSAEIATLIANGGFILSLVALLLFSSTGLIPAADAVMLFLGFRMQNSNLGQTSASLMRFARAKAMSEAPAKYKELKLDPNNEDML